jgi:soluble lytic murein transglycosylase-like protein
MQLMPDTAAKLGVKNSFDANENVAAGSKYIRELLARYNNDPVRALAAYNAGAGRVEQYNGVPPYRETRAYVAKIIREFNRRKLEQERLAKASKKPTKVAAAKHPATPDGN